MASDQVPSAADLRAGALRRRVLLPNYFVGSVIIEQLAAEGDLLFVTVRTEAGDLQQVTLSEAELRTALASALDEPKVVQPNDFFLLVESARIRLAYAYDPHFAVSLSGVEALPHQIEAVYDRMLPQARLRFLLADDPGAGKTIMAGLLIKELRLRGAAERILILCPAPLTLQWQDELHSKFDEQFERMDSDRVKDQLAGNPWDRYPRCVASIDFAKQADVWPGLMRTSWDLVVIDEAHKCAARTYGKEVKKTNRYQLAERLSAQAERLLLMTATPHQGDPNQFGHLLRLLDGDQFYDGTFDRDVLKAEGNPWLLRRMKEDLRDFDGKPLFSPRNVLTQPFDLSPAEDKLYKAVTAYINEFLPKQKGGRRQMSVALARTVLQRRLASSLRAIRRSLERRLERFTDVLDGLKGLDEDEVAARLKELHLLTDDDERETDDETEEEEEEAASGITAVERVDDLRREVERLKELVAQTQAAQAAGEESKLKALRDCLNNAQFNELHDGRGKLLIFTEHKDTLDYLTENLRKWGYTTCEIHGGMNAVNRKEAERTFLRDVQVCVATEAAGEGINLQFCHLMINYDMPWNPNRLEQRMGRVHRIGQRNEVHIFNFAASNTVEGRILQQLLRKMNDMKKDLGDRIFDVIGMVLRVNGMDLEDILREAASNPKRMEDFEFEIEKMDPSKLKKLEEKTGVALAVSHVDLRRVRAGDYSSEERRLMPEYVEDFIKKAADQVGPKIDTRADGLWRVEHVPEKLRATTLLSVQKNGRPLQRYGKLTLRKEVRKKAEHVDAELFSPGHPLFGAMAEVLDQKLAPSRQGAAVFIDPRTSATYALHFFEARVLGEAPGPAGQPARRDVLRAKLLVILEDAAGKLELAPPDVLHDLTPVADHRPTGMKVPDGDRLQRLERWLMAGFQRQMVEEARGAREHELKVRHEFLDRAFAAATKVAQNRWGDLAGRVAAGEEAARLARDEALKKVEDLGARKQQKLAELAHLRIVRPGPLVYLGTAVVITAVDDKLRPLMHRDDEVELKAIEIVLQHELAAGREPSEVWKLHDGSGFDIRSLGPPDAATGQREVRRIEVKGRADHEQEVMLTPNEWLQARRHGDSYWLYAVWGCKTASPKLVTIQNPGAKLHPEELNVVKGYRVVAAEIAKFGKQEKP